DAAKNPIVFAHWRLASGVRARSVLSRIQSSGLDYTQRPNKLAYHLVVAPAQQPPGGPAWILAQPGLMQTQWAGAPGLLATPKSLPMSDSPPAACVAWEAATGDAGWAGIFAEASLLDPTRVSYIVYEPGFDPLPLLVEAAALLPPRM